MTSGAPKRRRSPPTRYDLGLATALGQARTWVAVNGTVVPNSGQETPSGEPVSAFPTSPSAAIGPSTCGDIRQ